VHKPWRTCLLIDTDPQGSLTLWHKLCARHPPPEDQPLKVALRGVGDIVRGAKRDGTE
jgi:chromosome partitioning protein